MEPIEINNNETYRIGEIVRNAYSYLHQNWVKTPTSVILFYHKYSNEKRLDLFSVEFIGLRYENSNPADERRSFEPIEVPYFRKTIFTNGRIEKDMATIYFIFQPFDLSVLDDDITKLLENIPEHLRDVFFSLKDKGPQNVS